MFINDVQWIFLLYFIALSVSYILLNISSFVSVQRYNTSHDVAGLPPIYTDFEIPISIIAAAFNEEISICDSVRALLQLEYAEYEVIIVNDGSTDRTLELLVDAFGFERVPEAYRDRIATQPIRGIYRSTVYPNLRLVDKQRGLKADASNAGVNVARFPLVCVADADSLLQRDSLQRIVQPFLDDPTTIAVGGTVRIANGCQVSGGFVERVGLSRNPLALFQVVEYLRGFLYGRLGWSPINALLIISGAFGLFRKETLVAAGGYRREAIGEDMELVVRLHRQARLGRRPYKIVFVPDPICWTAAPVRLKDLRQQRMRWQRGLAEVLSMHRQLFFHPDAGTVGWIAFPYYLIFELLGPVIEVVGFCIILTAAWFGWIDYTSLAIFAFLSVSVGTMLSASALLLDEISFRVYRRFSDIIVLFAAAVVENLGYRQMISVWRLVALVKWLFGSEARWGSISRAGFGAYDKARINDSKK